MDLSATQVYEDEEFLLTQKISHALEKEESVKVGTLSIDSTDYQIKAGTTKIGRHSSSDIIINDPTVSKLHAEIEASDQGSTWICDLNSSNKTKLNNLTLRPTRLYELKNGSTIEFGRVRATYHTFPVSLCHQVDTVIPETPVPSRQKVVNTIIPNTPDSLSNSSSAEDDGSIILGTQKAENSVFRQPQVLQQRQSTSIGKKNVSMNESDDSQIAILSTSDTNTSENQVSIFDAETQKFEKEYKMASKSIHDIETQGDISECLVEANNIKAGKQLSKINIHDKTAGRSVDIHDIETQSCIDDINERKTQKNKTDIQDITEKKFTDVHTDNNISKGREKNLVQMRRDIHDLETQKFDEYIAEDTSETQLELGSIERCEQGRDISDMETQFVVDSTANETSNDRAKDKDSIANTTKNKINENVTKLPRSRSSSPESLNLSSPGVEDCPSPLNQSGHLLESSCLSEFFGEGIDKQEKMQASNVSTPAKVSEKNSNGNLQNEVNNEKNNDEDIFEAPTQRINYKFEALMSDDSEVNKKDNALAMCKVAKKKRGKSRSEQTNSGSETDAEEYVVEKQCESSEILSELPNKDISNRNDPGTSVESEDMFDVLTQQLDDPAIKDTTNSSINQPQKVNEINRAVDDTESTQIINIVDQNNRTNMSDINDVGETTSKDFATKNNQNDDMATMHIINAKSVDCTTNLERENIDRESTAQVISEIEDKKKRNSTDERNSSQVNLIDTLEQKLNEMFDNVNNDTSNIHELPHMSTQCLEDVLESSQSNDSINKSTVGNKGTNSVPQKQLRKKNHARNQHSHDLPDTEVNTSDVNMVNTEFGENVTPCQNVNSSHVDHNERAVNNNTAVESNKKTKRISKTKNTFDAIMEPSNDDNRDKTTSNWSNKRNLRNSKSMRQKNETTLETSKQGRNSAKLNVDDAEENTICKPCPSADGQCAQTLDTLYEINDDILIRLPAVRISGTLLNPVSPSASSTSSMRSTRSKQGIAKNKRKKRTSLKKSLHEQGVGNSEKNDEPVVSSRSNSVLDTPTTVKISDLVDTSEDSETDSETKYKRFQQIADRMLGNELDCLKQQDKGGKRKTRVLTNVSKDPERSTDVESKNLARTSLRMTRHSSRQSESLRNLQRETHVKSTDKSTESKTKSIIAKRKNMAEESVEQITSKKCKATRVTEECPVSTHGQRNNMKITTNRHSPNSLEFTKPSSRECSPIIENRKSANKAVSKPALEETQKTFSNTGTDGNIDSGRSNIKRTRQIIYDRQVATHVSDVTVNGNSKKNQSAQTKGREMQASQSQNKILRVLLSPIKSLADEGSQEVERIMATGLSNAQDKNLSIRESSKAKIFQRELRTRCKKRSNLDTETDSISTENGMSETGDSDNTQLDNPAPRAKRRRSPKNSLLPEIQVSKKEAFKKPRIKNSTNFNLDSSAENTIGESSQGSTDSNASTSSRVSRSKVTSIRKKEKMELNQDRLIDESASGLNTSGEITYLSTPSRMRRSTSILNNFTPSAMRHKVLFTGITEDYSKVVKTLGGSKIEDPAKCTILVTDKVRRTYKFLCALAKGIPIVAIDWLKDSEAAARFLDWENYILKDPVAEAKFGFKLRKSFAKAKEKRLLDGYIVVLTPNVAPPPTEELKDMVSSCGGKALLRPPTKWPEKAIVLSREEDLPNARKFLIKAPKTVTIQSTEFILTGILRQETDFKKYKLM